ncbi:cell division inhibitor SepF [Caloramator quimbayensis]|uniref:Cell division protein SepF n=1 Tax=Caloramator quimbayensis TaxID=1147123 RepID=A0A1T4X1U8_9CLOT|nr:cell division protein SepF [Caloramator quimbayensis]SKA83574.1 cell division inhibitor SepF [Caloramator quimbayensis]
MSGNLFKPLNKMMGAIGLTDYEEEDVSSEDTDDEIEEVPQVINSKKNKIVSIKNNNILPRIVLKKPVEFQDIMEIIDDVKSKRTVVINMIEVDSKHAQRMIDYIVGACYALNGSFEEITKSIYIFAPENVEVSNELKSEISRNNFFSFNDR